METVKVELMGFQWEIDSMKKLRKRSFVLYLYYIYFCPKNLLSILPENLCKTKLKKLKGWFLRQNIDAVGWFLLMTHSGLQWILKQVGQKEIKSLFGREKKHWVVLGGSPVEKQAETFK